METKTMPESLRDALSKKGWHPMRVLTWGRVVKADPGFLRLERDGAQWTEHAPLVAIRADGHAAIVRRD